MIISSSHTPRLFTKYNELTTSFDQNGQQFSGSCGATYQNNFYVFGGDPNANQILRVENCQLKSIGTLPFDFINGACGTDGPSIILCFSANEYQLCRQLLSGTQTLDGLESLEILESLESLESLDQDPGSILSSTSAWSNLQLSNYGHGWTKIGVSTLSGIFRSL